MISNIKTVEDVFAKCDNIQIFVSSIGLDSDRAENPDVTGLGTNTEISIIDWTSEECLTDEELMRETVVGLESDSYTNGFSKIRSYYRYSDGKVSTLER